MVAQARTRRSRASHRALLDYLTVLPCSHVRLGEFQWQYALYDVFHTKRPAKVTHALGMAPNTFTWLLFASLVPLGRVDGGLVLSLALVALYLWYDRAVGLVLAPVVAGMWVGARALDAAWGAGALSHTAVLAACLATFQALGHAPEPVPPPWSGCDHFVPVGRWLKSAPWSLVAGYGLMALIGPLLEYWASLRLLPVQAMMILNRFGYRPAFRAGAAVKARVFGGDICFAIEDKLPEGVVATE